MLRIALMLLVATTNCAADWPHVRGPNCDAVGDEIGLADRWPESGPPVLWTRELGAGYSSFVAARGRAFTLFQTVAGMYLVALDADTGAELWKERVGATWQHLGMYPGPYASPTWSEGRVFYATPTGIVGCVGESDGREVWKIDVRAKFRGRGTGFGFASTPTVESGRVYLPVGGSGAAMVALSSADGSTVWASGDEPASYCPACPISVGGRRLIVGFFQNCLMLFDADTGRVVAREQLSGSYDEHAAWPLCDGRSLLIASPFRVGAQRFELKPNGRDIALKTVWTGRPFSNDVCSSALSDGSAYGFDIRQLQASVHRASRGSFTCLDFATGKVRWETPEVGQASVIVADGKLILWTETGRLILAKATPEGYVELSRAGVLGNGGMCWAAPALANKRLIVRDHKRAVCLWLGPPGELDPNRPTADPAATSRGFDWTRLLPKEPDYPNDAPSTAELTLWFAVDLGLLIFAAALTWLWRRVTDRGRPMAIFAGFAFVLGAAGTTAIGATFGSFVLTWPVCLYATFRGVMSLGLNRAASGWQHEVSARLMLVAFAGLCYGYYTLCMAVGYAMGWGFLGGFGVSWPLAWVAERSKSRTRRWLGEATGFAIWFWVSGLIPGWKAALAAGGE